MTRDDIIRMAIKCQLVTTSNRDGIYADALQRFAALVAAAAEQPKPEPVGVMQESCVMEGLVIPVVTQELPVGTPLYAALVTAETGKEIAALREERRRDMFEICSLRESEESLREEVERLQDELRQSSIDITRAEVERLREEIAALKEERRKDMAEICSLRESEESLREEVERLREALTVAAQAELYDPATGIVDADVLAIVQDTARAALRREDQT